MKNCIEIVRYSPEDGMSIPCHSALLDGQVVLMDATDNLENTLERVFKNLDTEKSVSMTTRVFKDLDEYYEYLDARC